jgi:cell division protease FtsH
VETLDAEQIKGLFHNGKLPDRDYTALNGNLTTDENVKVNINKKKEEKEALLDPLDKRGPEELEITEEGLNTPPIKEGAPQDQPLSFPNEDDNKKS